MEKRSEFSIRRIEAQDKEQIIGISSQIWEGGDHVPRLFDQWVQDRKGEFAAVWFENKIIGFGKLTYLNDNDVWLEGLRGDPQTSQRGIGKALINYFLEKLKVKRPRSVRFSTYFGNHQSRSLSEKAGFNPILVLSNRNYEFSEEEYNRIAAESAGKSCREIPEHPVSLEQIYSYLESSGFFRKTKNFIVLGWTCYPYSRELIKKWYYDARQYYAATESGKITGLLLCDMKYSILSSASASFFEAENTAIGKELFEQLKENAVRQGKREIELKVPTEDHYLSLTAALGMTSWEQEDDFLLYEYQEG